MNIATAFPSGWQVVEHASIGSTNAEALHQAMQGAAGPLWITARNQTAGRGRSGRAWRSAGSSLAATLLFSPGAPLERLPGLALVAGIATHRAVEALLPPVVRPHVRLKWPNDVLIGHEKVSGILIESTVLGSATRVAIGIGINLALPPKLADREVTAIADHAETAPTFEQASRALAAALAATLERWSDGDGFATIRAEWLARSLPIGEPLSVNAGGGPVAGGFGGIDADGNLDLILPDGTRRLFTFGDVALRGRSV